MIMIAREESRDRSRGVITSPLNVISLAGSAGLYYLHDVLAHIGPPIALGINVAIYCLFTIMASDMSQVDKLLSKGWRRDHSTSLILSNEKALLIGKLIRRRVLYFTILTCYAIYAITFILFML